jgi:hypothetical protein
MRLVWISRKIGFRYSAFRVGDKAMNDLNVTHESENDPVDVLFETDWRRDEMNESTKEFFKNASSKRKYKNKVFFLAQ